MLYFMDQDQSGHWYVVPETHRQEWDAWVDMDPENELSWNVPDFAEEIGGAPSRVKFSDPEIP